MERNELKDKVVVITGAARGIGREIALKLAAHGAHIAIVDVEEDAAGATATDIESLGVKARAYRCDVSSLPDVESVGEDILGEFDHVDVVVNNAGITRDRLMMRMTSEDWDSVMAVNLTGAFNLCKVFSPQMLKRREGSIVNIASVIGQMGNAGQANYGASKAGLIGLTKSLAKEFAGRGVRVNAVAPGFISTAMTDALKQEVQDQMRATIPLDRFGTPGDVANVVLFLVSDLAGYVTGQVINCDGGMVMAR
jgi:3-oxoacyl-[acyl-carrier protein] reductase